MVQQLTEPTTTGQQTTPPAVDQPATQGVTATVDLGSGFWAIASAFAIIPIVFTILFHLGASYLSYQKYGSIGWAILDFFFAVFYYPYYAFFLSKEPSQVPMAPVAAMMGGKRGGIFKFVKKWF